MTRLASLLVLIIASQALPSPAHAADPTPAERFQMLTTEAEGHYAAGRYQAAVDSYLAAYAVVPSPDALYNVGYIYETNLKNTALATDFYRRVVRDPSSRADLVKLSTERISAIEAAAAVGDVRPKVLTGPGVGGNTVGGGVEVGKPEPSVVPWVLIGVGGAAIVGGIFVGVAGSAKHSDFENHDGGLAGMRDNADSGKTLFVASDVLWLSGVALAATGTVMLLMRGGDAAPSSSGLEWAPSASPDGAGITMRTGF
ncbi:MAG: hypothetical protein U1F43_22665 [Myxococcota bacterium]